MIIKRLGFGELARLRLNLRQMNRRYFMIKTNKLSPLSIVSRTAVVVFVGTICTAGYAWDTPVNITESDADELCWVSSAPSINVYEDGAYIATVHNQSCFGPVYESSVYQLSAHDYGLNNDFSPLSLPYLVSDEDQDDTNSNDDELEFGESLLYFELNNTDGDLGIHGKVDGDEWQQVRLEDPTGRSLIEIVNRGNVAIQGLTELFFESAEPTFDELNPMEFFARFPEGTYEWVGLTTDNEEIEGEAYLSHKIPAAPTVFINGTLVDECDSYPAINANIDGSYTITWDEIVSRHPTLGPNPGAADVEVENYQVVLEREEQLVAGFEATPIKLTVDVDADVLEFSLPVGLINSGQKIKNEVLVRSVEGNQSATELCWTAN